MTYQLAKALHIIGFVSWFAGLFYIVRLFIYQVEAAKGPHAAALVPQFQLMQRRLWYGITWPAMIFTWSAGLWLAMQYADWGAPWLHIKLFLLFLLTLYHLQCGRIRRQLSQGAAVGWSSLRLRLWNEVATIFLVVIVIVAVFKQTVSPWGLFILLATLSLVTGFGVWFMAKRRQSNRHG